MSVVMAQSLAELPEQAKKHFEGDIFSTLAWYRAVENAGLAPGESACFAVISRGDEVIAVVPLVRDRRGALRGLTTQYSCLWHPLVADTAGEDGYAQIAFALAEILQTSAIPRFDALPVESAPWMAVKGRVALRYRHFANWFEPVSGVDWPQYLARRPGELRTAITRRSRALIERDRAVLRIYENSADIENGIADYLTVYDASWKPREPFAHFNPMMMREMAAEGYLRLGILSHEGAPIAAQIWVVYAGVATVLKLAHVEAQKSRSPGTVLTALMLENLLSRPVAVREIDFGRGDDGYKSAWAGQCRERYGIILADPWRLAGAAEIARHWLGRWRRGLAAVVAK